MESGRDGRNWLSPPLDGNINVSTSKLWVQGQMKSSCREFLEYKPLSILNWKKQEFMQESYKDYNKRYNMLLVYVKIVIRI